MIAATPCPSCGQYTLAVDAEGRLACTLQPAYSEQGCPNPLQAHETLERRAEDARAARAREVRRRREAARKRRAETNA